MTGFAGAPRNTAPGLLRWWPVVAAAALLGVVALAAYVYSASGAEAEGGETIVTSPPGTYEQSSVDDEEPYSAEHPEAYPAPQDTPGGPRGQELGTELMAAIDGSIDAPELVSVAEVLSAFEVTHSTDVTFPNGNTGESATATTPNEHMLVITRQTLEGPLDTELTFHSRRGVSTETWEDGTRAAMQYTPDNISAKLKIIFVKGDLVVRIMDIGQQETFFKQPTMTLDQLRIIAQAIAAGMPAGPSGSD
ncbi:MAG: hypothetical protein GEU28_09320 [Dehalococcoidia bacterium]|nr:hypothetical protein [Dehalococcoidia bacterium]